MKENISLLGKNTFGFDIKTKYYVEVNSVEDVENLIDNKVFTAFRDNNRVLILSGGSNILFKEDYFDGFVVHNNIKYNTDTMPMSCINQCLKFFFCTKVSICFCVVKNIVTVV